jgi:hypothetical protein
MSSLWAGVHAVDLRLGLEEGLHHLPAAGAGEVTDLRRHDLQVGGACDGLGEALRSIAGAAPVVPCSSTMLAGAGVARLLLREPVAGLLARSCHRAAGPTVSSAVAAAATIRAVRDVLVDTDVLLVETGAGRRRGARTRGGKRQRSGVERVGILLVSARGFACDVPNC